MGLKCCPECGMKRWLCSCDAILPIEARGSTSVSILEQELKKAVERITELELQMSNLQSKIDARDEEERR